MTSPIISILMPIHNDELTLDDCLNSIWAQSFTDFELILINDGSTDQTESILSQHTRHESRLSVLQTPRQGIVRALNHGLRACTGQYVARMDGDDLMLPDRLKVQLSFIKAHPECDLIGTLVEMFTTEGSVSSNTLSYQDWSNRLITHQDMTSEIFVESPIMHPSFFGKREMFQRLGGYQDLGWAEDYDFVLRLYQDQGQLGKVPEILIRKRDAFDRLSRTQSEYKRPAMFRAKIHYLRQCGHLQANQSVLIVGTGSSGRALAEAFQEQHIPIRGFVDNRLGPPDRTVLGFPAWGFPHQIPDNFFNGFRKDLIIIGIGDRQGRDAVVRTLERNNFTENKDFFRLI